jgi:hypothetical protein
MDNSIPTNDHPGSNDNIMREEFTLGSFPLNQIFLVVGRQDFDTRRNYTPGPDVDGASIVESASFPDVHVVLDLEVVPICAGERRLDLDPEPNMAFCYDSETGICA